MSRVAVGRNDPCPCGSGRKYKKCCLAGRRRPPIGIGRVPAADPGFDLPRPRQAPVIVTAEFPDGDDSGDEQPPAPNTVPVLPVEVGVRYTYPEPYGMAEVTYVFPAGQT